LNTKGSSYQKAGILFDIIIILASLVHLHHKDEIAEGNKGILDHTYFEKYFKKENNNGNSYLRFNLLFKAKFITNFISHNFFYSIIPLFLKFTLLFDILSFYLL